MQAIIQAYLVSWGVGEGTADVLAVVSILGSIVLGVYGVYWIGWKHLLGLARQIAHRSAAKWDDALLESRTLQRLLHIIPLVVVLILVDYLFADRFGLLERVLLCLIVLNATRALDAFLNAVANRYQKVAENRHKPIRPIVQALVILLYLCAGIIIVSLLLQKQPWSLLTVMGGMTAVTMLIFQDTILGLAAGIQLGAYDMVREGDWIEMPKYGADGDVMEVTLNTVKVQNWDKTISTIPTRSLVTDSVKNWRGMSESGGRRIKRSIFIDMNTVRFADEPMLDRFRKMALLQEYVRTRQEEIDADNAAREIDLSATVVNGRRQTNLGIFRAYLLHYLRSHPKINESMTLLVRHLQPTAQGLPIEIYVFSNDKVWANYESIQADIFDHVLASLPEFGLRVYQQPSGADLAALGAG